MARDCHTAASILTVIAGKDIDSDPATAAIPFVRIPDYASACSAKRLENTRLGRCLQFRQSSMCSPSGIPGVPDTFINIQGLDSAVSSGFEQCAAVLGDLGAQIKRNVAFAALDGYLNSKAEVSPASSVPCP